VAIARQRIHLPPGAWSSALAGWVGRRLWDGPAIEQFERRFADHVGAEATIVVPSGRAGLRFIFEALDLEPGSEILFSAFGYPVVPHLARTLGFQVKFVDCEMETLGMDPEELSRAISPRTRAIHNWSIGCARSPRSSRARALVGCRSGSPRQPSRPW
jgi:O-acetylhomoserine/O-acetylserine sulfhydrylase-like pyridoxal-dependent enzyme